LTRSRTILIAFGSFALLGVPSALLGVVWPSLRQTFDLSHDAAGVLLVAKFFSYFAGSFCSGRWANLLGGGRVLIAAAVCMTIGLAGMAAAPHWPLLVAASAIVGLGQGALDGVVNIVAAARFGTRWLNWLHASFGLGSTLTPGLAVWASTWGSWRMSYWIATALAAILCVVYSATVADWATRPLTTTAPAAPIADTLRLPALQIGVVMFLLVAGLELSAGQWIYSLFTESRGIPATEAAAWLSGYWASFTAGRVAMGWVAHRFAAPALIRACLIGVILGAAGLFWPRLAFAALLLFGFSLGPLFAMFLAAAELRFGRAHAANAIGVLVAASSIGLGVLPAIGGALASRRIELIPAFLLVQATILAVFQLQFRKLRGTNTGRAA